jgi:hypothetical protein
MLSEDFHPRDEELLMTTDSELSGRRATRIRAHLVSSWDCRARMAEIEDTIADFARVYRQDFGPELPSIDGAGAQLKTKLAELAARHRAGSCPGFFRFASSERSSRLPACPACPGVPWEHVDERCAPKSVSRRRNLWDLGKSCFDRIFLPSRFERIRGDRILYRLRSCEYGPGA